MDADGKVHIVGAGTATITLQTEQSQNYNAVSENVTVVVAQKAVTVTADDKRKVYGEDDPALTYTDTGVVAGDDLNIDLNRTSGEDVGEYDITADLTKANPNYKIEFVPGKLIVEQRTVTLTWGDTSLTYDGTAQRPAVTVGNLLAGDTCDVTVNGAETNVGSYTAIVTGLGNGNYKLPDNVTMEFAITPKDITVEITPNGGVYDAVTGAEAKLIGVVDGDTVDVTLTYTGIANDGTTVYHGTDVPAEAGSYTVAASIDDGNYNLTGTVIADFVVARADAEFSVSPDKADKTYGDAVFSLTPNHKGSGDVTYESSNTEVVTVDENGIVTLHNTGEAAITAVLAQTANYEGGKIVVTVTVARRDDTLTVKELAYEVTYGDADFTISYETESGSEAAFTSSDENVVTVDKTGKVHIAGAGTATIMLETKDSKNYNAISKTVTVNVAPKAVTVTADSGRKIYGDADPELGWTPEGLVNEDTLTGITVTREEGEDAGTYAVTAAQEKGSNPDYDITFVDGTMTIEQRTAALNWGNTTLRYSGTEQKPEAAVSNLVAGDTCTVSVDGAQTNAGNYTATAIGLSNDNYKLPDNVTMGFVIIPKDITVDLVSNGGVYGSEIAGAKAEPVGVVGNDTVDVILTYTGTANDGTTVYNGTDVPTEAGSYTVTAAIDNANYNLTGTVSADFVIARANAELSVGAEKIDTTYGNAAFALTPSYKGNGTVTYESSNTDVATVDENGTVILHHAGEAAITVTLAQTDNYEGGEITVTITVARKGDTLKVAQLTYNVIYGDADFAIAYETESGSKAAFTSSDESVATVDETGKVHIAGAGEAIITLQTAQSENYNAVSETVIVKVAPKPVTVTADDKKKTYGEDNPELTWTPKGMVNGDTLTGITVTCKDGKNAGSYAITAAQDPGANPNYEITFVDGVLTIERRDIADAVVELGSVLIANGETQTQEIKSVTVANSKGEVIEVTCEVTGNTGKEPGTYRMTITGTGNFTGTITRTFVIAPAPDDGEETDPGNDVVIGEGTIGVQVQHEPGAPATKIGTSKAAIIEMLAASGGLTAEELAQVADGANIDVILIVKDGSGTISTESKAQIEKAVNGYTIGQYIDISLYKQITRDGQNGERIQITGTHGSIAISLEVPEKLLNTDTSITRTFWIVRNHEGEVEFLPTTYDAQPHMLTFETDKFSDYAIVYKDTKRTAEEDPGKGDTGTGDTGTGNNNTGNSNNGTGTGNNSSAPLNTATGTVPNTADSNNLWRWLVLMLVSCAGLVGTMTCKKKKRKG